MINLYFSYCKEDKSWVRRLDFYLQRDVDRRLRRDYVEIFDINTELHSNNSLAYIDTVDIFIIFLSPRYFSNTANSMEEFSCILSRCRNSDAVLIPVVARGCLPLILPELEELMHIPANSEPLSDLHPGNAEKIIFVISETIRKIIQKKASVDVYGNYNILSETTSTLSHSFHYISMR